MTRRTNKRVKCSSKKTVSNISHNITEGSNTLRIELIKFLSFLILSISEKINSTRAILIARDKFPTSWSMVHEQLLTNKYLSINKIRLRDKIHENAKFLRCLFRVRASESTIWCLKSGTRSKYPGFTAGGTGTERLVKFQISSRRNRYAYINILCGRTTREIGTRAPSRVRLINFIFLCHPFSSNRAEGSAHRCLCATYDNILPQKMI